MTKEELFSMTTEAPDNAVYEAAKARWDSLSKPIDGLGDLKRLSAGSRRCRER